VVEVATVTPTLTTSSAQGGTQITDFVLQTTLHGRVDVEVEGGVATQQVTLSDLKIQSDCTGCADALREPLAGGESPDPVPSYAWSTTPGATFADFQFQLNSESVPFDAGAGQGTITLTAEVEVEYVDAAGQARTETRRVRMLAGAETVTSRASAQFGVRGAASSGGSSSSTAGSTVLGVSTGTAMVAGVGLVAVVALAAGAAVVAARKRRGAAKPAQNMTSSSSSAASLELAVGGAPIEAPAGLGEVADAYGAIQVDV
jgi:hypothetical protein